MKLSESRSRDLSGDEWLWEIKYDGWRLLAEHHDGAVTLKTRGGADATKWFPEITRALQPLRQGRCIVDGELCVLDDIGRSDFDRMQARARMRGWRAGADSVVLCVFDVLVANGVDVMHLPLLERKALLARMWDPAPPSTLRISHVEGEGDWLLAQAIALELEGVVAKRIDSPYVPGDRSQDWVKRKRAGAVPPQRFRKRG